MVKKYKEDLTEEIEPQILELIERAKKGLRALERKQHSLKTKVISVHRFDITTGIYSLQRRLTMRTSRRLRRTAASRVEWTSENFAY